MSQRSSPTTDGSLFYLRSLCLMFLSAVAALLLFFFFLFFLAGFALFLVLVCVSVCRLGCTAAQTEYIAREGERRLPLPNGPLERTRLVCFDLLWLADPPVRLQLPFGDNLSVRPKKEKAIQRYFCTISLPTIGIANRKLTLSLLLALVLHWSRTINGHFRLIYRANSTNCFATYFATCFLTVASNLAWAYSVFLAKTAWHCLPRKHQRLFSFGKSYLCTDCIERPINHYQ